MLDIDSVSHLKVLVMGDAIMDEYVYVKPVGKAVKEAALSCVVGETERFKGGVWAAAAHTANFCRKVDVLRGPTTMWNTRLVDDIYLRKLFVMHQVRDNDEDSHEYNIKDYDLVIVTDFGHGMMTKPTIERVTRDARFLAVNTQTNATNYGFNVIKKYPRADFVVLDHLEARLAAHDSDSEIEEVIRKLGYHNIIVTLGAHGAIGYDGVFYRDAARAQKILDTMGSGDAFLSITAPFACIGTPMKDLVRLGNAAGAAKVSIVGHRQSVTKDMVRRYLDA